MSRLVVALLAFSAGAFVVEVEHAMGATAPFHPRGVLEVSPTSPRHKMVKFVPASVAVTGANASALGGLLAADGFYRVRMRRGGSGGPWATASLRACDLAAAEFEEEVGVSLSAVGEVIALAFANGRAQGRGGCAGSLPEAGVELSSTATVTTDSVAQVIPVQAKVGKPPAGMGEVLTDAPKGRAGGGGEGAAGEEPRPPKGFMQKYWHILLPLALLLLTTKEPEPESVKTEKAGGAKAAGKQA